MRRACTIGSRHLVRRPSPRPGVRSAIRWLGAWRADAGQGSADVEDLPVDAAIELVPGGTALGAGSAYPRVRTAPVRGDVVIAWCSALRTESSTIEGAVCEVSDVHVAEDHVRLHLDGQERVFRWAASELFAGDRLAQGVFRP